MGEALLVELRATPGFYKALKGRECPARSHEGASGATPLGTSQLEMGDWKDLGALLGWFRDGVAADPEAELAFSPKLTKALRASVHGTATAVGLGGLGTSSRGLGEERRVVVMAKTRADRALPVLDEKQDHQAFWTYRWAQQAGLQVSRDEVTEMVVKGALTPQLQAIWDTQAARQKAVQQLCTAVAAGDLAAAEAALTAQPGLLADKMFDVESGVAPLHVAAREGQVAALELLLSRGADIEMLDGHGWTALQVSRKFEQSDAEGALLRAGAHDPDKGKSILDRPAAQRATKPTAAPAPAPAAQNGTAPVAKPASASPAAPPSEGALDGDSNVSVCGTERDNAAADVSSNADDYVDLQYQAGGTVFEAVAEEEAGDGEGAAAASDSARAQAEAVALAAQAAAEAEAAAAEAAEEEAAEAAAAEAAAEVAAEVAINAFNVALAAAEAAEAAAEEAEGLGGSEAAERAAAFRHECDAAVAAVAAAAVAAGESQYIDDVLTPAGSRGAIELTSSPPVELASVASVCGSDLAQRHSLDSSDLGAAATSPLSTGGSVPSFVASLPSGSAAAAAAEQEEQAEKEQEEEQKEEEEEEDKLAAAGAQAVGAAGEAVAASGSAATATGQLAGAGAAGATPPEGQPASEAVAAAVADLQAKAAVAAEQAVTAAKGAAAAAGKAASAARAELEAKLPEWSVWVQEHPGSVMAGAGVTAAAIAALLLMGRRR